MTEQHPITPPPELVKQWVADTWHDGYLKSTPVLVAASDLHIATVAAQWGADHELEACCEWLQARISEGWNPCHLEDLRAARRPKPPSDKELALTLLSQHNDGWAPSPKDWDIIRRALEQLNE